MGESMHYGLKAADRPTVFLTRIDFSRNGQPPWTHLIRPSASVAFITFNAATLARS